MYSRNFFSFSFFLGLQGQHIILCASGNSSKFSGIYSFQEIPFPFAAVLFTGFSGLTTRLVLCLVTITGYREQIFE